MADDKPWFYARIRYPKGHVTGSIIASIDQDRAQRAANGRARRAGGEVLSVEPYDQEKHGHGRPCCVSR